MKEIKLTARFDKDFGLAFRDNADALEFFNYAIDLLARGETLPDSFDDHALEKRDKNYVGFRECHLDADLLLIYRVTPGAVVLHRVGTHKNLFPRLKVPLDIRSARREKRGRKWRGVQ